MSIKFPSSYARDNCLADTYCEIAMESFFEASKYYQIIKKGNYSAFNIKEYHFLENKAIITIVFSAMCIESFFNDFAAASLGDVEFYDNFDKLSTISKFQLIAQFILNKKIDKGKSYYGNLKKLFKLRDSYIHNKSTKSKFQGYSEEEIEEIYNSNKDDEFWDFDNFRLPIENIDNIMKDALDGLKAIYSIAQFFDKNDSNVNAVIRLFHPSALLYVKGSSKEYREFVFSKLKLKAEDYYEI